MAVLISGVSGTWTNGQAVTISGSGFGAHADYGGSSPYLCSAFSKWDSGNFNEGNFVMGDFPNTWRIINTGSRSNSTYHVEKFYYQQRLGALANWPTVNSNVYWSSFWFKILPNTQSGKFWRWYADGANIWLATGGSDTMIRGLSEISPPSGALWSTPNSLTANVWAKVEILIRTTQVSSPGFSLWLNHVLQVYRDDWVPSTFNVVGHDHQLGDMIDAPSDWGGMDGAYCFDDAYVDMTMARVELGNANTWAGSTVREVQPPTSWNTGSIGIHVNTGAFSNGAPAWVYVVDSTGAVNANGYQITINSGSSVIVPVSGFAANPTSGQSPLLVNFTDQSTNSPDSWSWNFGANASPATSTAQNPSTTYAYGGAKTVTLAASNSAGTDLTPATTSIPVRYLKPTNFGAA
jgi:hypothetical protein